LAILEATKREAIPSQKDLSLTAEYCAFLALTPAGDVLRLEASDISMSAIKKNNVNVVFVSQRKYRCRDLYLGAKQYLTGFSGTTLMLISRLRVLKNEPIGFAPKIAAMTFY